MRWPYNRGWHPSRWWERKLQKLVGRMLQRLDLSPEASLEAAQAGLRLNLRKGGPDAVATANSMVGVADELRRQDRYAEELLLREQIVQTLRRNLGVHHEGTLEAEAKLGRCLIDLDRTEEAEPLLTHVVAASEYSPGTMSPDTCLAMVCLAVVHREAGRLEEARRLLEEALPEYALRGQAESSTAMDVTWFLAATLFKLHEFEEADPLFRHVLDVRGRTRGPDDPGTLEALELLIRVLMRTGGLAEAKIMATSLVERRTKVLGQEHADTLTARELLDSIDSG